MTRLLSWCVKALVVAGLLFNFFMAKLFADNSAQNIVWYESGKPVKWDLDSSKKLFKLQQSLIEKASSARVEMPFHKISDKIISIGSDTLSGFLKTSLDSGWITPITVIRPHGLDENLPFAEMELYLDDILLLKFKNNAAGLSEIERLETEYKLQLISNNIQHNQTLLFRNLNRDRLSNSAQLAAEIYLNEKSVVKEVQPNRMNLFAPLGEINDVDLEKSWFVEKNGANMSCGSGSESTADAEISQAWANGATGRNTKVAVIDFYGFDYNHPDMQGQMTEGWDCINNKSYDQNNFYFTNSSQAHGMAVAGVIAAKANNSVGSAGVAHDSKVIPFLIDGSEASVVLALQKAISSEFNADVINCSFGSYFPSPAIKNEIDNAINFGRENKGTIIVASHGNDYYDDLDYPQYPSSYEEVLSVGASTPDDLRKSPGDGWDVAGSWGTNYGDKLHLAAPGVCIFTTDLSGANGYGNTDYINFHKTSAAAPIVSGIVALMIGQNANLTYTEIKNQLINSADKVNSGTDASKYDYNYAADAGRSREMGYGRVNALKAIGGEPVGIEDNFGSGELSIEMNTMVTDLLKVKFSSDYSKMGISTRIIDLSGKTMYLADVEQKREIEVNTQNWASGMYLVQIIDENQTIETQKIIKANH